LGTGVPQQTTMLNWANLSERAQKIKGLNFCASQFVTEDEVKYCVAKLFSGDVKFATAVLFLPSSLSLIQSSTDPARSTSCIIMPSSIDFVTASRAAVD
jgi:hypothetical protein